MTTTPSLNLDPAFKLDINGIYEGNSFVFQFERFADDGVTYEGWPGATYELAIGLNEGGPAKFRFTVLSGNLIVAGNIITVKCLASENLLRGGTEYFYELNADFGSGITELQGKGKIKPLKSVSR